MALAGRKTIKIDAPIIITSDGTPVWMDRNWAVDFFDWLSQVKLNDKLSGLQHMNSKVKLTFVSAKDCTMFGLKYASKIKRKK
jgi:hypothetical protein|tara:strand:+ start:977 stop:1225 length:249 start_codon:yes stop_codon:yes gene_type:complete